MFLQDNFDDDEAGNQEIDDDQQLLAHLTRHKVLPPCDIRWVLAVQQSQVSQKFMQKDPGKAKKTITIDGVVYIAKVHNVVYSISKHQADKQETSLVDHGANGGMACEDVMVLEREKYVLQ